MKKMHMKAAALTAATLALSAAAATAAPSGTPSPEGAADLEGVSWWPNGAAEHSLWVDDEGDRVWGLPGGFGYLRFSSTELNGVVNHQIPPADTSRIELADGTVVGTKVANDAVWKLTAPADPYNGKIYASYLDSDDEDGDGNVTERFHREIGPLVTKELRPQPELTSVKENVDITAIIDVSGSMDWNDPEFKRRDAADLLFRTAVPGDRIGVNKFTNTATELLPMTTVNSDDHAKTLSAQVRPLINNEAGTDYMAGLDKGFTQLYQDAVARNSLNSRRKLAIFVSDGKQENRGSAAWSQYNNTHIRFTHSPGQYSWPVCAIQLGNELSSRASNRLKRIAAATGGAYIHARTDAALVDAFKQCRGLTSCEYTIQRRSWGSVTHGQDLTTRMTVAAGHSVASFLVTGDHLRHDVRIVGPSGTSYGPNNLSTGMRYKTGRSWAMFEVDNPASGQWGVDVTANGVAEGEEDRVIVRGSVDRCGSSSPFPAID